MKDKKLKMLILLVVSAFLLTGCVEQKLENEPQEEKVVSVVSTSVTICELLDLLEIENVVGVPTSETYTLPKRYEEVERIGPPMGPDMEALAMLSPTYILSPQSLAGDLKEKYENVNLNGVFLDLSSTEKMYEGIVTLGGLLNQKEKALSLQIEYKNWYQAYQEENKGEGPKVLLLMGLPGSYVAATPNSYAGSLVEMAGGQNVYAEETSDFINVNPEDMLLKDPDIILLTAHALPNQVEAMFKKEFTENDIWKNFRAVEEGKVVNLDYNKFGMSADLQYQEALEELKVVLYE
ncbi:MAG TPA: heme ABC transporter substrate-binding protein IsdE [Candidatus Dorea intestinavium]|nr:heme ABC transporter substrate-binding protein IsdE [Candidatus Dorea intestinavium]